VRRVFGAWVKAVNTLFESRIVSSACEKSVIVSAFVVALSAVLNTKLSRPVPPARMSMPSPPFRTLLPALPVRVLASRLPVALTAAVPVRVRFSAY
jgi:hypothetical protein